MGFWKSLSGLYFIEIISAAPARALTAINELGIILLDITYTDDLRVKGYVFRKDFKALQNLLAHRGEELNVIKKIGAYWTVRNLCKRPLLAIGMLVFLVLALYLPTRVLFVRIDGNKSVPARLISEKAQLCGIGFGASRRAVRSERTKNELLAVIPELQWVGVNTLGCVAVISVEERSTPDQPSGHEGVCSIVAARDGIISDMIVSKGNRLCNVGQAVKKGEVLVSGYTDCGISIKAERAEAEITAYTTRQLNAVTPATYGNRSEAVRKKTCYSLRVGKNIINFCKDSGISDTTCVKIRKEYYLTLPGGFQLPISILVDDLFYYNCDETVIPEAEQFGWVETAAAQYLREQMLSGEILSSIVHGQLDGEVFRQQTNYSCLEIIGQVRSEEILQGDGKTNG